MESIRRWVASSHSLAVLAEIEMRWIEVDALLAWPPLEEFLAIVYFEREREISVAACRDTSNLTADEACLLVALIVARWDVRAASRCLRSMLGECSARAAARAAAKVRATLARQPLPVSPSIFLIPQG